jgi:hypothetical protein
VVLLRCRHSGLAHAAADVWMLRRIHAAHAAACLSAEVPIGSLLLLPCRHSCYVHGCWQCLEWCLDAVPPQSNQLLKPTLPYRRSISTTASLTGCVAVSKVARQNSGYDCEHKQHFVTDAAETLISSTMCACCMHRQQHVAPRLL